MEQTIGDRIEQAWYDGEFGDYDADKELARSRWTDAETDAFRLVVEASQLDPEEPGNDIAHQLSLVVEDREDEMAAGEDMTAWSFVDFSTPELARASILGSDEWTAEWVELDGERYVLFGAIALDESTAFWVRPSTREAGTWQPV